MAKHCGYIGVSHNDFTFENQGDACYKVIRQWIVIDNCVYDGSSTEFGTPGYWTYFQEIVVSNSVDPEFVACDAIELCINQDCETILDYTMEATDDCTPSSNLWFKYELDLFSDGIIDLSEESASINEIVPMGEHSITWYVEDYCNNITSCVQTIFANDCTPPAAYCIDGLSVSLSLVNPSITLWATDFDYGGFDECSDIVAISFEADTSITSYTVDCSTMEQLPSDSIPVNIWFTDSYGNQSYCATYILATDQDDICDLTLISNISGNVSTENMVPLANKAVTLESDQNGYPMSVMTDEEGNYAFENAFQGQFYKVSPYKDEDPKEGVTTLDLVYIQQHILTMNPLDSPYKLIAADINKSGHISASDLLELRKLILGINNDFLFNTSWRFIDEDYDFNDPDNPWNFEEYVNIYNLEGNESINFIGMKTGDVNESMDGLISGSENRSLESQVFNFKDSNFENGDFVHLSISTEETVSFSGFQFDLNIDFDLLEIQNISSALKTFGESNYHVTESGIRFSFAAQHGNLESEEALIDILFKAKANNSLSKGVEIDANTFEDEWYTKDLSIKAFELQSQSIEITLSDYSDEIIHNKPNPFSHRTIVSYSMMEDSEITYTIYNSQGSVFENSNLMAKKGINTIELDSKNLPAGIYHIEMDCGRSILQHKMLVIK